MCCRVDGLSTFLSVLVKVTVVLQRLPHSFLEEYSWLIPKIPLGFLTAVVVVCSCQGHPHRSEDGADGDQRLQYPAHKLNYQGQEIEEVERKFVFGCRIPKTSRDLGHEVPEWEGCIVCDVVCLG